MNLQSLKKLLNLRNNLVLQNILLVGGITLLFKVVSFYKEVLIASSLGLSVALDTFLIAMLVPGFINTVFLGSFKNAFIPNYIAESKTGNAIAPFQAMGFVVTGGSSFVFILISYLATDVFLEILFPGHDAAYYHLVRVQLYYLLPCILLWGLGALLSGLLNINGEFKAATGSSIFLPAVMIICLLFFKEALGKYVLAISTLIGSVLGFIYLWLVCYRRGVIALAKPDFKNPNGRIMLAQVPAKVTASFLSGMHSIIESYFAAQLVIGSISAMSYGKRLTLLAIGLVSIAMSNVLLPYFSKQVINNRVKSFDTLFKLLKIVFVFAAAISLVGIVFSDTIVRLVFERNEFTAADTEVVSRIQQIFLIYLPFKVSGVLLVNFLTSINKNNYMAIVSFISVMLNLAFIYLLMDKYGLYGIALASTIGIVFRNIILFIFTLKQRKVDAA